VATGIRVVIVRSKFGSSIFKLQSILTAR